MHGYGASAYLHGARYVVPAVTAMYQAHKKIRSTQWYGKAADERLGCFDRHPNIGRYS